MGQYTSYYLYQKYEQRGEQEAIPVYPNVYSIDADGTRERVVKIQDDPQCGYDPPVKPIYKWINIPITQDYICDDCPTYQTRWVRTDETICSGTPEPPTPTDKKFVGTYNDGTTREVECNGDGTLTSGETQPSVAEYSGVTDAVIGDCVTIIGEGAFRNGGSYLPSLTAVTIPNSVTTIGGQAFYSSYNTIKRINSNIDGVCNIPNSVTSIGEWAFFNCHSLRSIDIPNSVTSIGDGAFAVCSGLTSVNIPSGVTSISNRVFYGCNSLTSIDIPDSVTSIGDQAFDGCSGLTSVTCFATTPPSLRYWVFDNTNDCPIYVLASSVNAYKTAENWSTYASRIQPIT